MNDSNPNSRGLNRRDFLRLGSTGAAGMAITGLAALNASGQQMPGAPDTIQPPSGKLPTRRYGKTGLQISALVGASDWNADVIPAAVQAGVNYWHKAHRWSAQTMPDALKSQPRESYYLEVVVEFHFGYHSLDEAKNDLGMVKAYTRLKNEGLVKHLAISQHHYNDIGGNMAYEILPYVMDNLPYEATQFFHTYGDKKEISDLIDLAKQKDFGVIAMKTMGGVGRAAVDPKFQALLAEPHFSGSTPGAAMVKWLMSNPSLTAAVIATKNFDQFQENLKAAQSGSMTVNDHENLNLLAAFNKGMTCLLCSDCVSTCPEHIAIADIFRYERYAMDYHELSRAKTEYKALTKNGTSCIACGDCMPTCKADINIVSKLKDVHKLLG
jgi:NAD-dependent dihydropyrimidine dehydrogenase PreA subunit